MTQTILIVSNSYRVTPYEGPFGLKRKVSRWHPLAPYVFANLTREHGGRDYNVEICDIGEVGRYHDCDDIALAAFSTNTTNSVPLMYRASRKFHQEGVPVVWGGVHASSVPSEVLESGCVDSAVVGQGEGIWEVLLDDLRRGNLKQVYFGSPSAAFNLLERERNAISEKDSYTSSEEDHLSRSSPDWSYLKRRPLYLSANATRGCGRRCNHCCTPIVSGTSFQTKDVGLVRKEIADALAHSLFRYVAFADNNLVRDVDYAKELMGAIEDLDARYITMASIPELVRNEDLVEKMRAAGFDTLLTGLESLNQVNLEGSGKSVAEYREGIELLHRNGIAVFASVILGFPGDTTETANDILRFCDETKVDLLNVNALTPFPGTRLHERLAREGRIESDDLTLYNTKNTVISTPNLSRRQLQEELERLRSAFYSPRRTIGRVMRRHATLAIRVSNLMQIASYKVA